MSYVLDALRRAEADRHRGQVPDLHAAPQAGLGPAADPVAARSARRTIVLVLVLAAIVLIGAGLWFLGGRGESRPEAALPVPAAATSPPATASPAPLAAARPPTAAEVPPPVALPAPTRRAPPAAADPAAGSATPAMDFGGAFDSPDPRARMLIINGEVWREGDEPVPGWKLERITLHAARFQHQGRSIEVPYAGTARRP